MTPSALTELLDLATAYEAENWEASQGRANKLAAATKALEDFVDRLVASAHAARVEIGP